MAKLNLSRAFEAGRVIEAFAKAKIEGIEDFPTYLADLSENVIRALRGQLTLRDNFLSEERDVTLSTGIAQSLQLQLNQSGRLTPRSILIGRVSPVTAFVTGFQWELRMDGSLSVIANFAPVPASGKVTVSLIILY
jgi:hypothetical protein